MNYEQFCSKSDVRTWLLKPFRTGFGICFSNGYIIVAIPDDGRDATTKEHPNISATLRRTDGTPHIVARIPLPPEKPCSYCGGTGKFQDDSGNPDDGMDELCLNCDGSGKATQCVDVGTGCFQRKYLAMLADLPSCVLYVEAGKNEAKFVFNGGVGVLMQIRRG